MRDHQQAKYTRAALDGVRSAKGRIEHFSVVGILLKLQHIAFHLREQLARLGEKYATRGIQVQFKGHALVLQKTSVDPGLHAQPGSLHGHNL